MKKLIVLLFVATLLIAGCSSSKLRPIDKIKYPPLNEIKIPDVVTHTLSNGMKVYLLVDNKLPLVQIQAQAHCGSVTDPLDKIGLASLASNCLSSSTLKYEADELRTILTDNAIGLSSYATSRHSSVSINYLTEDEELAFDIFTDVIRNPTFDEDEFETTRTRMISQVYRRNDDAASIAFREFQKIIFGEDYPLIRQQEIYTLNAITLEDVQTFYTENFYPKNMVLTVFGDFDLYEMKNLLEDKFATWYSPSEYKQIPKVKPVPENNSKVYIVDKQDASQTWVLIGHKSDLLLDDEDYPAMDLLNEILGGGFNSRVYRSVRAEKGLSYSPGAFLSVSYDSPGALYLLAPTATQHTLTAAEALVEELTRITKERVTKEELEFAKDAYFNSLVFRYESPASSLYSIRNYDYYGYDRNFANILKDKIEKVTINDIYRVAQKYLKPDELIYLFVGNKDEFADNVAQLGEAEVIELKINETPEGEIIDYPKGKEIFFNFLNKAKSKMPITSLSTTSTITSATPMGDIAMDKITKIIFPDKISDNIDSPMGSITVKINGNEGKQSVAGSSMDLPSEHISAIVNQTLFSYFGWLYDPVNIKVGYLHDEVVDNIPYKVLRLEHKGSTLKLWMNPKTHLPDFTVENLETPQGVMEVKSEFIDYQEYNMVLCPKMINSTLTDGTLINTTIFNTIEFNKEIPAAEFEF